MQVENTFLIDRIEQKKYVETVCTFSQKMLNQSKNFIVRCVPIRFKETFLFQQPFTFHING